MNIARQAWWHSIWKFLQSSLVLFKLKGLSLTKKSFKSQRISCQEFPDTTNAIVLEQSFLRLWVCKLDKSAPSHAEHKFCVGSRWCHHSKSLFSNGHAVFKVFRFFEDGNDINLYTSMARYDLFACTCGLISMNGLERIKFHLSFAVITYGHDITNSTELSNTLQQIQIQQTFSLNGQHFIRSQIILSFLYECGCHEEINLCPLGQW